MKDALVEAFMRLAAQRRYEDIALRDIAAEAGVSLADFREAFPSKGAILAAFSRKIDQAVLKAPLGDLTQSSVHDRLLDVLMRRFDALTPYHDALRTIAVALKRDPLALWELNRLALNSMRFMLEAAEVESGNPLILQGLVLVWGRVFAIWLEDQAPDFPKTLAALDGELRRGERWVSTLQTLSSSLQSWCNRKK